MQSNGHSESDIDGEVGPPQAEYRCDGQRVGRVHRAEQFVLGTTQLGMFFILSQVQLIFCPVYLLISLFFVFIFFYFELERTNDITQ